MNVVLDAGALIAIDRDPDPDPDPDDLLHLLDHRDMPVTVVSV